MLHAAKSLGRGLRELGETVASSLTGTSPYKPGGSSPQAGGQADVLQKGIVTILDIEVSCCSIHCLMLSKKNFRLYISLNCFFSYSE